MYSKKPQAVLFDWDNTIVDSWEIIHASLNKAFIHMGHEPWSLEDVKSGREGIHQSLRDSFPKIFGDRWQEAKDLYFNGFLENHLDKITLLPNAQEVLKSLSEQEIYLCVVSNKTGQYLREEVEHLGLTKYFNKIIGATDAAKDKPHPDPVHLAMEGSAVTLGTNVWFIGDSETDLECALRSGCLPIFFGDSSFSDKFHSDERVLYAIKHVKNHDELLKYINGLR